MKIVINNHTKELSDTTCLVKVYQFLNNPDISYSLKIFKDCMPITFGEYVCLCKKLKNGYSFNFNDKETILRGEELI